jgi:site-specific DNA-methyltransferase (adenine-specific)
MKVKLEKIDNVIEYYRNPRVNERAIDKVASSIREFGFRQPIVVDKQNTIICGHTRFAAARKLGLEKIPIHVAEDLSEVQIKAYRIADNRVAEDSTWDNEFLRLELKDIEGVDENIFIGFEENELKTLFGLWDDKDGDDKDDDDYDKDKDTFNIKIEGVKMEDKDDVLTLINKAIGQYEYDIKAN